MNFQNIPRDDKTIKRAVVPKLGALSFFDYKQIEPRLTAYFAEQIGYPEFADQIRAGVGPYEAVARLATGKESLTETERDVWKRIFLGILYGAGAARVRETWIEETGQVISMQQARKIVKTFKENWSAIPALQDMVQRVHARRGYIRALDGRQLHMEQYGEHKLLNKLIQGSAAGIMKQAVVRVHAHLKTTDLRSHIVSVIHDELVLDGPERELPELNFIAPQLMIHEEVNKTIPILVDHEVSLTNWAEKIGYDEWLQSLKEAA